MAKKNELSPMMQQYFNIKKDYPGVLLFFRLGDFYEMFFDDAKIASEELDLVLTGRECGQNERAPMCGVPFHSADNYIARLVAKGYKIAICEQVEDPATAKGIVKRDVIRVITPGTVIESNILEDGTNNYLCAIFKGTSTTGICFADISTGEFHVTTVRGDDEENKIINQLSSYSPKEILVNDSANNLDNVVKYVTNQFNATITPLENEAFDYNSANHLILESVSADERINIAKQNSQDAICALGAVIGYIKDNRKTDKTDFESTIDFYEEDEYMLLDMSARRNLELTKSMMSGDKKHSLLWVVDKTKTAMGKRMIRLWLERPLTNLPSIIKRQNAVSELFDDNIKRDNIRELLSGINDIERLMSRIAYSTANAKELLTLSNTASYLPKIKDEINGFNSQLIKNIHSNIDTLDDIKELINTSINDDKTPITLRDGGMIKPGYSAEVDELRDIVNGGANVLSQIEEREKERTGIPKLKVSFNKVFGYFIEVTNSYKNMVPDDYIRKQTLTNCERYITGELKELEGKVLGAKDKLVSLEYELFCQIRSKISEESHRIQQTAKALATIDVLSSLAEVAYVNNYCCPKITTDGVIEIKEGRHAVVETLTDGVFVPNDTYLDRNDNRCAIITGPNMAGKSTYMRQIAIISLLAQIGSFVPAKSANLGIVDAIFTRVGASDDLATGRSTFMVEMSEVSNIIKNATSNSLIILDEIGRGTSTFDGMSIARAVLEYVVKKKTLGAKTLFATHYHELTAMQDMIDGVNNFSIAVKKRGDDITFLRRIVKGGADQSFGIEVAKLAGIPDSVIRRAKAILKELEANKVEINFNNDTVIDEVDDEIQYNFNTNSKDEILELIKAIDINTISPIEAFQTLIDLKNKTDKL